MTLQAFRVPDAESLMRLLRKASLFISLVATVCLTAVLGVIADNKSGLTILWIALLPAFWLALRFASRMAWDTSFKKTRLRIPATPEQVLIACILFFGVGIAFHSYMTAITLVGSQFPVGGAMILMAIPIYFVAFLCGLYVIYLPLLLAVIALTRKTPNSQPQPDAQDAVTNIEESMGRAAGRER